MTQVCCACGGGDNVNGTCTDKTLSWNFRGEVCKDWGTCTDPTADYLYNFTESWVLDSMDLPLGPKDACCSCAGGLWLKNNMSIDHLGMHAI